MTTPRRDPDERDATDPTVRRPPGIPRLEPPPPSSAPPLVEPPPPPRLAPPVGSTAPAAPAAPAAPDGGPARPAPIVPPPALFATASAATADDPDPVDERTVLVPRPRPSWVLAVEGGPVIRLPGDHVVLGRRPEPPAPGVEAVEIPDATRTLSKSHARLDRADGEWTVTDLGATNGVVVVAADGTDRLLAPGASAVVVERLVLGRVELSLRLADGPTAPAG